MTDDLFSVKGQIVLVSGASRGIGRGIAQAFADRGAVVVITGRVAETLEQTAKELGQAGAQVHPKVCDAADAKALQRLADDVVAQFGRIDTLVNCAGVNKRMRVERYDEATYDYITNINIRGAFFLSLTVGRHMIQARSGNQINIDSINSHRPLRRVAPYAMSKAAMSHMTRSLAMEWGEYGIRVNAVAPGFIATDLAKPLLANPAIDQWRRENTPLGRVGTPEDIAAACIFLASKAASYITGHVLYVDGGTTCGLFWPLDV